MLSLFLIPQRASVLKNNSEICVNVTLETVSYGSPISI